MNGANPYLNFPGNTEEAFNFYKSVFGGEFLSVMRFKDLPDSGGVAEADKDKLMHIALPLGNNNILMATDAIGSMGHQVTPGTNFSIAINAESREEADKLFNGLSAGGKVGSPMKDEFWGDYFGWLTDKFDIQWMISYSQVKR